MKNKFFAKLFAASVLSVSVFSFSACGKKGGAAGAAGDLSAHVPASSTAVFTLNIGQLMQKADYAAVKQMDFFKKALTEAPAEAKPILEDPAASGLDVTGKWTAFVDIEQKNETTDMVALLIPIKDAAKFEALVKPAFEKEGKKIEDKAGIKQVGDAKAVIAWNGSMLVIVGIAEDAPAADKDAKVASFFKPAAASVTQNADFTKRNGENKDFMMWLNTAPLAKTILADPEKSAQVKGALGALGLTEADLTNNTIASYQDFQNGKVEAGIEYTFSEGVKKQFGAWFKDKPSQDFSKFLPAQNAAIAFGVALDLKAIYATLSKTGAHAMLDMQLSQAGLTSEQLAAAIGGEGAVSLHINADNKMMPVGFSFVSTIGDKASFDKIVAISRGAVPTSGKFSIPTPAGFTVSGSIDDKTFAIGSIAGYGDKIAGGGYSGAEAFSAKNLQQGCLSYDINLVELAKAAKAHPELFSRFQQPGMPSPFASFEAYTASYGFIGAKEAKSTATLANTSKNSLAVIIEMLNKAMVEAQKANPTPTNPM